MALERLGENEAREVASVVLRQLGIESFEEPHVLRGILNQVVCYKDVALAVRVAPREAAASVRRGYRVAEHAGEAIAAVPIGVFSVEGHVAGLFHLYEVAGLSSDSWVAGQRLVNELHQCAVPDIPLPRFDAVGDLPRLIESLRGSVFSEWCRPLHDQARANQRVLETMTAGETVVVHGDIHAGQVLLGPEGYVLTDFDRAGVGDAEVDWGRIYAWHHAGCIDEGTYDEAVGMSGAGLRFDRVHTYGRAYALRYTTVMASLWLKWGGDVPFRLAGFADSLDLVMPVGLGVADQQ